MVTQCEHLLCDFCANRVQCHGCGARDTAGHYRPRKVEVER